MQDFEALATLDSGCAGQAWAKAMQALINTGTVWSLPGSYGRAAMAALEAGDVMLGTEPGRDYWGNRIPARHEVQEGTKGSRGLVVQTRGEEWAAMLEAVGAEASA